MRVKFKVDVIRQKVRENKDKHVKEYDEAKADYKRLAVEALEKELARVRDGGKAGWGLPTHPTSYQSAYDTVLNMFEMTTETDVELDELSFKRYIQDEWEWTAGFKASAASLKG